MPRTPPLVCRLCEAIPEEVVWSEGDLRVLRCAGCGLMVLDPLPEAGVAQALYAESYFRENYLPFEETRLAYFRERVQELEKLTMGRRVLDAGCGVGYFLQAAAERGWRAQGIETSSFAARYARERFGLEVWEGEFRSETGGGPYDVVTFWDMLAHLPNPRAHLVAAWQVLTPGGLVVIKSPHRSPVFLALTRALSRVTRTRGLLHVPAQMYLFTRETMAQMLEAEAFEVVRIQPVDEIALPVGFRHPRVQLERLLHSVLGLFGVRESFIAYGRKGSPSCPAAGRAC